MNVIDSNSLEHDVAWTNEPFVQENRFALFRIML
jgi:hypothetical protein